MTNNDELARNPVLAYADSYRSMANQGSESVPVWGVITDLERNIAPLYAALLAERDADKKLIADSVVLFETLRQRIAELGELRKNAFVACRRWADKYTFLQLEMQARIAELEARRVSVKLPKLKMLNDYLAEVAEEERKQIIIGVRLEFHRLCKEASAAAGIKLEVGE